MCLSCIEGLLNHIRNKKSIADNVKRNDVSLKSLEQISWNVREKSFYHVRTGPCCAFSQSLRDDIPQTTVKPSRLPQIISEKQPPMKPPSKCPSSHADSDMDSDDDEDEFLIISRKKELAQMRKGIARYKADETSTNDLLKYHESPTSCTSQGNLQLKHRPSEVVEAVNRKRGRRRARKKSKKSTTEHNIYQGALILPMFGLGIQADSFDEHWYVDHMALAISKSDDTPSVGHCVLSESCAESAFNFMKDNTIPRIKLTGSSRIIKIDLPSPEDPSKHREVRVNIIIVKQSLTVKQCLVFEKGANTYSNDYLSKLSMFSQDDIGTDIDYTVILGEFDMEKEVMPQKLLLIRPTSMLSNIKYSSDEKADLSEKIYKTLRAYSGKRGYEMRRVCGSSGKVTSASDKDILSVLHEHEGAIPRKVYAVIILRGEDRYYLVYRRVNPKDGDDFFTSTHYCPPKDGGSFKMPKICSSTFFPLADLTYNKMMAVLLLQQVNILFKNEGLGSVAEGPMKCELIKITKARHVYQSKPEATRMHHLIITFNSFNNFSMVGYASGYHFDHYYDQDNEYIENKMLFSLRSIKKGIGRGGHILGTLYVFAILDWGASARRRAAANRAARAAARG